MIQQLLPILQTILTAFNIAILVYAFGKFLGKPHNSLEQRVTTLEVKQKETEDALHRGNDKFREIEEREDEIEDKTNVLVACQLAFTDFEIAYCVHTGYEHSEDLHRAKNILQTYLSNH